MNTEEELLIHMGEIKAGFPTEYLGKRRSDVKLLRMDNAQGTYGMGKFEDIINILRPGDLLVYNDSKTIPSSFVGYSDSGKFVNVNIGYSEKYPLVEIRDHMGNHERGERISFQDQSYLSLLARTEMYPRYWYAEQSSNFKYDLLSRESGRFISYSRELPDFPGYIYESPLSTKPGSVEYPSALRPFTQSMMNRLQDKGIQTAPITLHCNLGSLDASEFHGRNRLLPEWYNISKETALAINTAAEKGHRVIAIGTTVVRALASTFDNGKQMHGSGFTSVLIDQNTQIHIDGIVSGMHDPSTSHILLLSAFSDLSLIRDSYASALESGFSWHEFGDSCIIIR